MAKSTTPIATTAAVTTASTRPACVGDHVLVGADDQAAGLVAVCALEVDRVRLGLDEGDGVVGEQPLLPARLRVMGAKLTVLATAAVGLGAALQVAGYAENRWLAATRGTSEVPNGFWGEYAAMAGRGVLLTLVAALVGFALANAIRNTAAALGIGFVYFAILESVVRAFKPGHLARGGQQSAVHDGCRGCGA